MLRLITIMCLNMALVTVPCMSEPAIFMPYTSDIYQKTSSQMLPLGGNAKEVNFGVNNELTGTVSVVCGGKVITTGGAIYSKGHVTVTKYVQITDLTLNKTTAGKEMPTARGVHSAVCNPHTNQVIVCGGANDYENQPASLDTCDVYDVKNDIWSTFPSMPAARCRHTAVYYEYKNTKMMYLIGGVGNVTGFEVLSSVIAYNFNTKQWDTTPPSLNKARFFHQAAISHDNIIVVCGGTFIDYPTTLLNLDTCEYILPSGTSWGKFPVTMQKARSGFGMVTVGKNESELIYMIGGSCRDGESQQCEGLHDDIETMDFFGRKITMSNSKLAFPAIVENAVYVQ